MLIQVLGPGCAKCNQLAVNTDSAAKEVAAEVEGFNYTLQKITDIVEITSFGVIITPAVFIDGKQVSVGKLLTVPEIKAVILEATQC